MLALLKHAIAGWRHKPASHESHLPKQGNDAYVSTGSSENPRNLILGCGQRRETYGSSRHNKTRSKERAVTITVPKGEGNVLKGLAASKVIGNATVRGSLGVTSEHSSLSNGRDHCALALGYWERNLMVLLRST